MYLQIANNQYGLAMSEYLPFDGFRSLSDSEIGQHNVHSIHDNDKGDILEVDLKYPQSVNDTHNDFPLAPEKLKVTDDDRLSEYCKTLKKKFNLGT